MSRVGTNSGDSPVLSLRVSCDRCRVQKLKCSVPAGSEACERCMRAKVPCVFGRRIPSKRTNKRVDASICPVQNSSGPPPPSSEFTTIPVTVSASASATSPPSTCPIPTLDFYVNTPISVPDPGISGHAQPNTSNSPAPWLELRYLPSNDSAISNNISEFDWLNPGFVPSAEGNAVELDEFELPPWSQVASPPVTASWPTDDPAAVSSSLANNNSVQTEQRLTTLVSGILQQLKNLEEGPWHTESARSLKDYPIGTVFELLQQFCAMTSLVIGGSGSISGTFEESCEAEEGAADSRKVNSNAAVDTPTMLLLICGYMWMVRIYSVVMGHFWEHLVRMPASYHMRTTMITSGTTSPGSSAIATTGAAALRLGELPCTDTALAWHQIHTAVHMLLDVLHEIEDHLGRGAMVARDKTVALLLTSIRRQNGSSGGLSKRATEIKELLREKMGLSY